MRSCTVLSRTLMVLLTGISASCLLFAQEVRFDSQVEESFKTAMTRYVKGDYETAYRQFENIAEVSTPHHRMTAVLLMTGKSLYKLGRYSDCVPFFERLVTNYPQSKYVDDAYYGRAAARYRSGRYVEAVRDLLWIADFSEETKLLDSSGRLASFIMETELSGQEIRDLQQYANSESSSALIAMALAQNELLTGDNEAALATLNNYKKRYRSSRFDAQISQLMQDIRNAGERPAAIGVVLPLSGYFAEEGLGVLRGIRFAHEQTDKDKKIELAIRDSESNIVKAINVTRELIGNQHVAAIIGDLESDITACIGALAAERKVTLVAPAATENGVASIAPSIFQLNSDLERKGSAVAEYAIRQLHMQTFATMAPADDYGQQMTASFSAKVDELGGRIIAQTWYYGSPEDLGRQFKSIREAAFRYDSTDVEQMIADAEIRGEDLNERDIPVLSVDAFFIPIYTEDIKYIAPQFAQHNIRAQILGGEYLDNLETLTAQQIQPYIAGAIFISDYFPDENDRTFRSFRSDFRLKTKKTPERWEVFGHDSYAMIRDAVQAGAKTGKEIARYLGQLNNYKGMKGLISFRDNNGVNQHVNFLQFTNGRIIKHEPVTNEVN